MNQREKVVKLFPKLQIAPLLGDKDFNMQNPKWEEADYKVCITLIGDFFTKMTSASVIMLVQLCREAEKLSGKRIYIDFSYQPNQKEIALLRENGLKEVFGWCSYRTLDEFDALLCSFSIHFELMSFCTLLWGAGIPLTYNERKSGKWPVLLAGGVIATGLEPLMGHKEGPMVDLVYFGEGEERVPQIVASMVKNKKMEREELVRSLENQFDNVYLPVAYEHIYEGNKLAKIEKKPYYKEVKDKIKWFRTLKKTNPMFEDRISLSANDGASRGEMIISHGCSGGGGVCYFCSEGAEAGVWREYDFDAIVKNFEVLKKSTAPNVISFFSLNSNFYSRAFDLYHEVASKFSYISVIALRADVVADAPEYTKLLKALGTFRLTVALEGISNRIRDNILNKNLSWDQVFRAAKHVFMQRFVMLKFNLIFSGYEEEEDLKEFMDFLDKLHKLRDECGAKTSIMFSTTTLVSYNEVALQWMPRKSTIGCMVGAKTFKPVVQHGRKLGFRFRFNDGHEFITQQLLVDAGRKMTEPALPVYRKYWEENLVMNSGHMFSEVNDAVFKSMGLDTQERIIEFWSRKRTYEELNPSSIFDAIPEQIKKGWYKTIGKSGTKYCLATPAHTESSCRGCGLCPDKEWGTVNVAKRNFTSSKTIMDIEKSVFLNKPKSFLRVVYKVRDDVESRYRFKIVHNHYIAGKVLRYNDELCKDFYAVGNYSDYVPTFHDQPDCWGGFGYFDIQFRTDPEVVRKIVEEDKGFLPAVNKHIESSQILRGYVHPFQANVLKKTKHVWGFRTTLPKQVLQERWHSYNGKMKVMDKGAGAVAEVMEESYEKSEFALYVVEKGSETMGFFSLGGRYNPFMAFWAFFGVKPDDAKSVVRLDRMAAFDITAIACKSCGKVAGMDILANVQSKVCPDCTAKLLAIKFTK